MKCENLRDSLHRVAEFSPDEINKALSRLREPLFPPRRCEGTPVDVIKAIDASGKRRRRRMGELKATRSQLNND